MKNKRLFLLSAFLVIIGTLKAQNPIITDQFTADPTAKVFEGKMYVYPSHDIPSPIERLKEWFCMADYHVFSSDNLVDWTDHGVILSQENVPWIAPDSYSMWAPEWWRAAWLLWPPLPALPPSPTPSRRWHRPVTTSWHKRPSTAAATTCWSTP